MKYNQYAYVETPLAQQQAELKAINMLDDDFTNLSLAELYADLVKKTIAESKSEENKQTKLEQLAVSSEQNLAEFIQANPDKITRSNFYNVALQLLGYNAYYEYNLTDPLAFMQKQNLPVVAEDLVSTDELINAYYRLLNTRAKNGQILLDVMAGRGYFTSFYQSEPRFLFFNGKSLPVFDTSKVIREVVYVESDLDTDEDGQSDLMQVTVFRPRESGKNFKVPVLYTASPYFGGTIGADLSDYPVDENLTDATTWSNPQYTPKPTVKAKQPGSDNYAPTEEAVHKSSYPVNEYMLARGFASVFAGAIGTRASDGVRITGAPEETQAAKEVIEWLTGDRIAYTDPSRRFETKADWSNGNIGMTGRSYLGTLQIAIATTGVKGLKTVVSEAAISSWYDYYREHGLVVAPGECQGEDLDKLAEYCQSNLLDAGKMLAVKPAFESEQKLLATLQDRETGQYSDFWDARNYRNNAQNIKCSWISVHGLNDWNVKPKNVYKIWQHVKQLPIDSHLFLHQGPHYNMNNLVSVDFTDLLNLWFVHELLEFDNNAPAQLPKVLIQDNLQADTWHEEADWADEIGTSVTYFPQADGSLTTTAPASQDMSFTDVGGKEFKQAKISEAEWEYQFICGKQPWAKTSLRFETDEFAHPVTLVGRPEIKVKVAGSLPKGQLSVALVDVGTRQRLTPTPKFLMPRGQELGYRFGQDTLQEFVLDKATDAKLISKGHMNLQNYQDMKRPSQIDANQPVELDFLLQPTYYTLPTGAKLALVIYSTDQAMTKRPLEDENYTISLSSTSLTFSKK